MTKLFIAASFLILSIPGQAQACYMYSTGSPNHTRCQAENRRQDYEQLQREMNQIRQQQQWQQYNQYRY